MDTGNVPDICALSYWLYWLYCLYWLYWSYCLYCCTGWERLIKHQQVAISIGNPVINASPLVIVTWQGKDKQNVRKKRWKFIFRTVKESFALLSFVVISKRSIKSWDIKDEFLQIFYFQIIFTGFEIFLSVIKVILNCKGRNLIKIFIVSFLIFCSKVEKIVNMFFERQWTRN